METIDPGEHVVLQSSEFFVLLAQFVQFIEERRKGSELVKMVIKFVNGHFVSCPRTHCHNILGFL